MNLLISLSSVASSKGWKSDFHQDNGYKIVEALRRKGAVFSQQSLPVVGTFVQKGCKELLAE